MVWVVGEGRTAWQRLPGSSRKPSGDDGAGRKFTAQSMKPDEPRMAKTIVFMSSIGCVFNVIALVRWKIEALMWSSLSDPTGRSYTRNECFAARHNRGYVGMYLKMLIFFRGRRAIVHFKRRQERRQPRIGVEPDLGEGSRLDGGSMSGPDQISRSRHGASRPLGSRRLLNGVYGPLARATSGDISVPRTNSPPRKTS